MHQKGAGGCSPPEGINRGHPGQFQYQWAGPHSLITTRVLYCGRAPSFSARAFSLPFSCSPSLLSPRFRPILTFQLRHTSQPHLNIPALHLLVRFSVVSCLQVSRNPPTPSSLLITICVGVCLIQASSVPLFAISLPGACVSPRTPTGRPPRVHPLHRPPRFPRCGAATIGLVSEAGFFSRTPLPPPGREREDPPGFPLPRDVAPITRFPPLLLLKHDPPPKICLGAGRP